LWAAYISVQWRRKERMRKKERNCGKGETAGGRRNIKKTVSRKE
jgi:hypothetical protein